MKFVMKITPCSYSYYARITFDVLHVHIHLCDATKQEGVRLYYYHYKGCFSENVLTFFSLKLFHAVHENIVVVFAKNG